MKAHWDGLKHFSPQEFYCSCCGREAMQDEFIQRLEKAREIAGVPFRINSGFRCEKHNRFVGGVAESSHTLGLAADIACTEGGSRENIVRGLISAGFTRIGIAKTFIHADCDNSKPDSIWLYA